jgi:hypothetical protein
MDRVLALWEEVVGIYCLNTIVLNLFYIVGGAHVAWSAKLGAYLHEWDLHHIGPHALVDGRLIARLIAPGRLYLDKVVVGRGGVVSDHTVVQPGAVVAPGAKLRPMTVLLEGMVTDPVVTYQGNPARGVTLREKKADEGEDRQWWMLEASKIVFGLPLTVFLFTYTQIPVLAFFELILRRHPKHGVDDQGPHFRYKALFFFGTLIFASMAVGTVFTICMKWILFGRVRPGERFGLIGLLLLLLLLLSCFDLLSCQSVLICCVSNIFHFNTCSSTTHFVICRVNNLFHFGTCFIWRVIGVVISTFMATHTVVPGGAVCCS